MGTEGMTWSERYKASHANYVRKTAGVKSVLEHRNVEGGEIYCVGMNGGGFEVRHYVGETLKTSAKYPSGTKAVLAYRALRDKLVPNRKPKVAKATKTKAKVATPKKATAKGKATKKRTPAKK